MHQHPGRLLGVAHLKHTTVLGEVDAIAAQGMTEVVYGQQPETMGYHSGVEIGAGLVERLGRIGNQERSLGLHGL